MTEMQATAATMQTQATKMLQLPFAVRPLGLKTIISLAVVMLAMVVSYFGFAVNPITRIASAAEHIANTAQHSMQANFQAPYINHYGFKSLYPAQQRVYADIYRAAYLTRDMVTVNDMTNAEICDLVTMVREDSPELFYLDNDVSIETNVISTAAEHSVSTVKLSYSLDKQDIPSARTTFEQSVSEAASVAASCQSDANKVTVIRTWMQQNAPAAHASIPEPSESFDQDSADEPAPATAYDALINGQGSDEGNAQLFNALCSEVGIDSRTATDDEQATNAVMLGNDWHYVDISDESNEILA